MLTGREIFVGLSTRTNMLGAQSVGRAFPEYPTTIVHVNPPAIHLKDYISMAGPEVMTVGKSEAAQRTFRVSSHWCTSASDRTWFNCYIVSMLIRYFMWCRDGVDNTIEKNSSILIWMC